MNPMKPLMALNLAVAALLIFASPASAGNVMLKKSNGAKVSIQCTGGGCAVTPYSKSGKRGKTSRRAGGRQNYLKLMKFYKSKGYR